MTAVEEDEDGEKGRVSRKESDSGSIILAGVKVGSKCHELLTWALVKVAQPADQVIALHVLTDAAELSFIGEGKTNQEIANVFNTAIGIYEGFCSLKQVELQFKITHGSSMQKALVEEAKQCNATKVILGTSKQKSLRASISLAKSCAKRLPVSTAILVVENGKVVFEKHGIECSSERNSPASIGIFSRMRWKFRRKQSLDFQSCVGSRSPTAESFLHDTILSCSNSSDGFVQNDKSFDQISSSDFSKVSLENKDGELERRESVCLSSCGSDQTTSEISMFHEEEKDDNCTTKDKRYFSDNSECVANKRRLIRGWSLLRAIVFLPKLPSVQAVSKRTSVIEWVLQNTKRNRQMSADTETKSHICRICNPIEDLQSSKVGLPKPNNESFCCSHHHTSSREENALAITLAEVCRTKTCTHFTYQELQAATSNFSEDNFIGKGGWSKVYKGILPDGKSVAVKVLNPSPDARQEVVSEVEILTSINHPNIITLVGYCIEGKHCLLVYDYICRGNLGQILGDKEKATLPWKERMKVAIGVAQAIDYLHNKCSPSIIHGDVKSSNILISEGFEPQLSDFGLAKQGPASSHIPCNDILGTFGYLAPEYFVYGKVSDKTDIYAFGVVLLELITGRRPIDTKNPNCRESLVMWAQPHLQVGSLEHLADPCLENIYKHDEMQRMMLTAAICTRQSSQHRPGISQVLQLLKGEDGSSDWHCHQYSMSTEMSLSDEDEDEFIEKQHHDLQNYLRIALLEEDHL